MDLSDLYIYIYIYSMLLRVKFLATPKKNYGKPTLRLVVVTTGFGVVFRLSSYFRNLWEMEKSCVECLWSDPKNVKV